MSAGIFQGIFSGPFGFGSSVWDPYQQTAEIMKYGWKGKIDKQKGKIKGVIMEDKKKTQHSFDPICYKHCSI